MLMAQQLGTMRSLPPEEIAKLARLREQLGLGKASDVATACLPAGAQLPSSVIKTDERY